MINEPIVFRFRTLSAKNTLYLDRDGVLNEAIIRGSEISSPRNLEEIWISDDIDALAASSIVQNWNLVIISNQPDLARNIIDGILVKEINRRINDRIPLKAVYICPHESKDNCVCRKPNIGLIEQFHMDYPDVNGNELMVGDQLSDLECASKAGIEFVLRKRCYNKSVNETGSFIDNLWELEKLLK